VLLSCGPGPYIRVVWNTGATEGSHSHLSILLIPVLVIPEVRSIGRGTRDLLDVIDYAGVGRVRPGLRRAPGDRGVRAGFVRHNVPDLLLVVLPMLRPLHGARLLRVLRVGRLAVLLRVITGQHRSLQTRALTYVGTLAGGSTLLAAVAMDDLERNAPGATIKGFGDSIWWAFTTVSAVGYIDRYPVTTGGRFVAAALMVIGVSPFGVLTASVATYFLRNVRQTSQDTTENELGDRLARLEQMLERIEAHLQRGEHERG